MNNLLKYIAILILILLSMHVNAQEKKIFRDKVFLKQGSVLVGSIDNYVPGESLTLSMKNGAEFTLNDEQIKKVHMFQQSENSDNQIYNPLRDERFYNEVQFALLTNTNGTGYSLAYDLFYQKSEMIAFGAGVGLDNYLANVGRDIFPIYANAKFNLLSGSNAPYIGMKLGYGMAFERESQNITNADGGLMAQPYFGIRIGSRGLMFNLFTGVKFQKVDYVLSNSFETRREDILHRRIVIGASAMF